VHRSLNAAQHLIVKYVTYIVKSVLWLITQYVLYISKVKQAR